MIVQQCEYRPSPQGGGHFSSCERNGAALDQAVTLYAHAGGTLGLPAHVGQGTQASEPLTGRVPQPVGQGYERLQRSLEPHGLKDFDVPQIDTRLFQTRYE
jgi:hypothetical protein